MSLNYRTLTFSVAAKRVGPYLAPIKLEVETIGSRFKDSSNGPVVFDSIRLHNVLRFR